MIVQSTHKAVVSAAGLIRRGEVVAFPTETVYGLGADATNAIAVAKIFETKERPSFDPLIVHLAAGEALAGIVESVPDAARELARRFWPGPLTLVLPKKAVIPDIVTAGLPSVAVRVPDHPVARELIERAGCPIAAPSANRFGGVSPTTAAHVAEQLGERIELILDGGPCRVGLESTIVSFLEAQPSLLRPGGLPLEAIEAVVGPVRLASDGAVPLAPGQLPRHYAPSTPLLLVASASEVPAIDRDRAALLLVRPESARVTRGFARVEVLAADGDIHRAAANLFAAMRRLDAAGHTRIYAVAISETGLGRAIMDRLRRAAAPE